MKKILITSILLLSGNAFANIECDLGKIEKWSGDRFQMGSIEVTNTGNANSLWNINLVFDADIQLTGNWSSEAKVNNSVINVSGAQFNRQLKPGESTNFGIKGTGNFSKVSCEVTDSVKPELPDIPTGSAVYDENFENYDTGEAWQSLDDTEVVKTCGEGHSQCLRVTYKPTKRGSDRIQTKVAIPGGEHYTLVYDIKFEDGFEFVRGGKLPGLSPTIHTTGCDEAIPNGWSVRPMWRPNGSAQAYHYSQDRTERCGDGERSFEGAFVVGQWQRVELEVKLNSEPYSYDGFVDLKVDGESVSKTENMNLRGIINDDTLINHFFFSTFYGGADSSWAPSKTTHIVYDNIRVINRGGETTDIPEPVQPLPPEEPELAEEPATRTNPEIPNDNSSVYVPDHAVAHYSFDDMPIGYYTKKEWVKTWLPTNYFVNGANEKRIYIDDTVKRGQTGKSARVLYPANVSTPSDSGAQWHMDIAGGYEEAYMSYWVKFDHDFDFVLGGKLPGFFISESFRERGEDSSIRLMWREDGKVEFYLHLGPEEDYGKDQKKTVRLWWDTEGFQPKFTPGQWHHLEIRVRLNNPGVKNGLLEGYFDGVKAAHYNDILYRSDTPDGHKAKISRVFFSTFFGGSSSDIWYAKKDETAWFDEFTVSKQRIGLKPQ